MNLVPTLFEKKEDCCGCGACLNICPKQAISMKEDECGFIYPVINEDKCIKCGQCKKVCAFQNASQNNSPIECYAAVSKNEKQAKKSASGGVFAAMATDYIDKGGVVFGAAFDEEWKVHHISVETKDQLRFLQGSKYVQSDIEMSYKEVKACLDSGRQVLFSGTPCQVAGLQSFLGQEYENLLTVDIVCHGVPSNRMFQEYIKVLESKYRGKVSDFTFRDKTIGWGINGSTIVNGKKIKIWQSASSYLFYFSKGWIYRENCYKCPYACEHRPADITLGDYWGIEKQHPEILGKNGWNESKGISCVVVNSNKGYEKIQKYNLTLKNSTFDKIANGNAQLNKPSEKGNRCEIIDILENSSWLDVDKRFNKKVGIGKYKSRLKALIPRKLKRMFKSI